MGDLKIPSGRTTMNFASNFASQNADLDNHNRLGRVFEPFVVFLAER
jgi:hypothetical protein